MKTVFRPNHKISIPDWQPAVCRIEQPLGVALEALGCKSYVVRAQRSGGRDEADLEQPTGTPAATLQSSMNTQSQMTPSLLEDAPWPLSKKGYLPEPLFDRSYLEDVFIKRAPMLWNSSTQSVRRGLRALCKQTGNSAAVEKSKDLPLSERDGVLLKLAFDNWQTRSKLSALRVVKETRRPGRDMYSPLKGDFARGVFETYFLRSKNDVLKSFATWALANGERRDSGGERFWTASTIQKAAEAKTCPIEIDSDEFARAAMLFAALLSEDEGAELLKAVSDLGCAAIQNFLHVQDTAPRETEASTVEPSATGFSERKLQPKIGYESEIFGVAEANGTTELVESAIAAFEKARRFDRQNLDDVATLFVAGAEKFLGSTQEVNSRTLIMLEKAYSGRQALNSEASRLEQLAQQQIQAAETRIDKKILAEQLDNDIVSYANLADKIKRLAEIYDPKLFEHSKWFADLPGEINPEHLALLPRLKAIAESREKSRLSFAAEAIAWLQSEPSPSELSRWLLQLDSNEYVSLIDVAIERQSLKISALIVRLALDNHSAVFPSILSHKALNYERRIRREILRFCDASTSIFDEEVGLRRVIIAERLRDLFHFGPLASLSDPSAGFYDVRLVGKLNAQIILLISNHLDIAATQSNLQLRFDRFSSNTTAADNAVEFCTRTTGPASLTTRLKEGLRKAYFDKVIHGQKVDLIESRRLIWRLEDKDSREEMIAAVISSLNGTARIEARHKAQLHRYLDEANALISTVLDEAFRAVDPRKQSFYKDLSNSVAQLSTHGIIGTIEWLEAELFDIVTASTDLPGLQTLVGDHEPISQRQWKDADSLWARDEIDLAQFYMQRPVTCLDVLTSLLRLLGQNRKPSVVDIVDELIAAECFHSALQAISINLGADPKDKSLRKKVEAAAAPRLGAIRKRLDTLNEQYGNSSVGASSYIRPVQLALSSLNVDDAASQCELLEVELYETATREAKAAEDIAVKERQASLTTLLAACGATGLDRLATIPELEDRWQLELEVQKQKRVHYARLAKMVAGFDRSLPEFAPVTLNIEAVDAKSLNPDFWLAEHQATLFLEFIEKSATKIETWLTSASEYRSNSRRALASVLKTYLAFLDAQIQILRSLGVDGAVDPVFEHIYEFGEIIRAAANPLICAQELVEAGEMPKLAFEGIDQRPLEGATGVEKSEQNVAITVRIQNALHAKAWAEAALLCRQARQMLGDEELTRVDQTADFCYVAGALENNDDSISLELVETAAAAIGTAGHPVHRSLSSREQLHIALSLVEWVLQFDDAKGTKGSAMVVGGWSNLLVNRPDFFKNLVEGSRFTQTARVLNQLLSGATASDLSERLWASATNMQEPGQIRADLLRFLLDHRHYSAILSLANRYEPTLRSKLEQLFELRAAAFTRPDLVQVAQVVASQAAVVARPGPFRNFVKRLPTAPQTADGSLIITLDRDLVLRPSNSTQMLVVEVPLTASSKGLVPERLQVQLFPEDDVTFMDHGGRIKTIYEGMLYTATDLSIRLLLGASWRKRLSSDVDLGFRLRFSARTITGENITRDEACILRSIKRPATGARSIDNETLREFYPGVDNTPAEGERFVGRVDELEKLHDVLVSAHQPSPVLLTGMRRIGKTSLLFAFHKRFKIPGTGQVHTVYLSIAELRSAFVTADQSVSSAVFKAITRALSKRHFASSDHNRDIGERLQERHGNDRSAVRREIEDCYDADSLADSLMVLSEKLLEWLGGTGDRIVFLIDEAEALVVPYNAGGEKRLQLEQFLQSLREISQTSPKVGILLSGSNHIIEFAKAYKNAFFGSCVRIELAGIEDLQLAGRIVAPERVRTFIQFEPDAVEYAIKICAGMPQFMWQVGAATASRVRSGPALRSDVRSAVSALVDAKQDDLPFTLYDVLEPLEHMISLQGRREEDLHWLILRRVAVNSSLLAGEVSRHFLIEQDLLELDTREAWQRRLTNLLGLDILTAPHPHSYGFKVPLFAEAFRSARNDHEYAVRLQRVAL